MSRTSGACDTLEGARIAGLPMYEIAGLGPLVDRFWTGLARALREVGIDRVPTRLDRSLPLDALWTHPHLLLAQTCGYPLSHALRNRVTYVATPCYRSRHCEGPLYTSLVMARADDQRRRLADFQGPVRVAINGLDSQSGNVALRATLARHVDPATWSASALITGSHSASLDAVRAHSADLCAIDCVTAALFERHAPGRLAGLKVVEVGPKAPGLPFITSTQTGPADLERLQAGLEAAIRGPALRDVCEDLLLDDVRVLAPAAYQRIFELEDAGAGIRIEPGR